MQKLAAAFGIRSIPSILDSELQMAQGAMPKHDLEKIIADVLKVSK
jgi:predicted DsbA family dithiol-disulfide isomerase